MINLRQWQKEALHKAIHWFVEDQGDNHFLINAAPGSGKTIAACAIAQHLIESDEIDRVVVIAPRTEIVSQWAEDFNFVTKRFMGKVTGRDKDLEGACMDLCATWAAVKGMADAMQAVCRSERVLVICDEHHHAAVQAAWGSGADSAFKDAKFALILTGTPIRSDGEDSVWLAYDDSGAIQHPEEGSYTLTYGQAVDLEYCRPVTFHRHEGLFNVDLDSGESVDVSGDKPADLDSTLKRIPGLQAALNFYRLDCTPQYEKDGVTPLWDGYQSTMLQCASDKLDDLRLRMPNAGGLVIAPNIRMAEYMSSVLEMIEGEKPAIVHSDLSNADSKIKAFRNNDKRWLVSVAMVSEGVDIKRLRVLAYLPYATTELAFRQAIGRVVRSSSPDDDTRAYVLMPSFETFDIYAARVEKEMSPGKRKDSGKPQKKTCPVCREECDLNATHCHFCEHEFSRSTKRYKNCPSCDSLNTISARECQSCGQSFVSGFTISLEEAMRDGAIIRGMSIGEEEVLLSEKIAPEVRRKVLSSNDQALVKILRSLPEESWGVLKTIMNTT